MTKQNYKPKYDREALKEFFDEINVCPKNFNRLVYQEKPIIRDIIIDVYLGGLFLSEEQKAVLLLKKGLENGVELSLDEICAKLGIRKEKAKILEAQAMRKVYAHEAVCRRRCEEAQK